MDNREQILQQVDAYLSGRMTNDEVVNFKSKMSNDSELASMVEEMIDLRKGIQLAGEEKLRAKIQEVEARLESDNFFNNSSKTIKMETTKNKFRWQPIAAIGAILLAAGMFFMNSQKSPDPAALFAEYYKPDNIVINDVMDKLEARGLADEKSLKEDSLLLALKSYEKYEYKAARSTLSKYLDSYPEDQTARFYMGLTQLQIGNYANSSEYLQPLCTEEGFPYQDAAKWYLAMCCTQIEGPDGMTLAKKYLKQLSQNSKSAYQGNAKAYLNALGL